MTDAVRLRIAIQKSGRLNQDSLQLLSQCGLKITMSKSLLFCHGENLPIDLLFVRDDDIPTLVMDQVCDLGIVGENVLLEFAAGDSRIEKIKELGFGSCRLSLAIPKHFEFSSLAELQGKRIATSYPIILKRFLQENNLQAEIIELAGSVELAPRFGIADLIFDLISTGETLAGNNLKEVVQVFQSQAVLIRQKQLLPEKEKLLKTLLRRIQGVLQVQESKYIMFHAPKTELNNIKGILPGKEVPTVLPLSDSSEKVAVHVVSHEGVFWETLEHLKDAGASSILVLPIEKMLV